MSQFTWFNMLTSTTILAAVARVTEYQWPSHVNPNNVRQKNVRKYCNIHDPALFTILVAASVTKSSQHKQNTKVCHEVSHFA